MITRLSVRGYKSLRAVELDDLPPIVVLYGPNSAGKSNCLDCLDLLAHLSREDTLFSAFQRHRGNRLGRPAPVRWFFSRTSSDAPPQPVLRFSVDLALSQTVRDEINGALLERESTEKLERPYTRLTHAKLRYSLKVQYSEASRSLVVVDENLAPLKHNGEPYNSTPYVYRDKEANRLVVKLERQAHPRYFALPRERTILSEIGDIVNHPHIVGAAREISSLRIYYVEPTLMRSATNDIDAADPGRKGEFLAAFYHWLSRVEPKRYRNLEDNLRRLVPGLEGVQVSDNSEGFLELNVKERGAGSFPAALVSEGTLRLLCLLGIAASPKPPGVVGYEEPENGVHPGRLREMLDVIRSAASRANGSQFFLTTHSPEVLTFFRGEAAFYHATKDPEGTALERQDVAPLFWEAEARRGVEQRAESARKRR